MLLLTYQMGKNVGKRNFFIDSAVFYQGRQASDTARTPNYCSSDHMMLPALRQKKIQSRTLEWLQTSVLHFLPHAVESVWTSLTSVTSTTWDRFPKADGNLWNDVLAKLEGMTCCLSTGSEVISVSWLFLTSISLAVAQFFWVAASSNFGMKISCLLYRVNPISQNKTLKTLNF